MHSALEQVHQQFFLPVVRTKSYEQAKVFCQFMANTTLVKNFEITLTTPDALKLVRELSSQGFNVGVGSVTTQEQAIMSLEAGASFIISAGFSEQIANLSQKKSFLYIPGVMTPTEVLKAKEFNFSTLKLFPYSSAGGLKHLKNISAPFPEISWIPTGGIQIDEALKLKEHTHVLAVGMGSQLYDLEKLSKLNEELIIDELKEVFKKGQL